MRHNWSVVSVWAWLFSSLQWGQFILTSSYFNRPPSNFLGIGCNHDITHGAVSCGPDHVVLRWSTLARSLYAAAVTNGAAQPARNPAPKKPTRFIHPQVIKMFQRAQFLMRNGDNVVAQKLLVRCLELNPKDSHSWLALARLEAKLGNYERAREIFSQSQAQCPNSVHLLHAWGHLEEVNFG